MRSYLMLALLVITVACSTPQLAFADSSQNVTEHNTIYFQGYMQDSRVYQTDYGYSGQKLVAGTSGSGTVSRTQHSEVYSGTDYDEISFNEWGVFDYKPYTPPATQSDLKNALCAKNYAVGSVISESYSGIQNLVKDTKIMQDDQVSVYQISSHMTGGTAKIGGRVQKNANTYTAPTYVMGGTYVGNLQMDMSLEAGNASILTLPCP